MIALTQAQARQIRAEAASGYPDEICGFLIGSLSDAQKIVTQLLPIANEWESVGLTFEQVGADFMTGSQRRRFAISPDAFYQADKAARAANQDILGFYHSHPDSPAVPSEYDLRLAQRIFPGYSYIIVAVPGGSADGAITSWILTDDSEQFQKERLVTELPDHSSTFAAGVDRILWEIWDPVGVNDTPEARSEYQTYVPAIVALLRGEASDAEFFTFLETTEREMMQVRGSNREHLMAVIAHLRRFAEGE